MSAKFLTSTALDLTGVTNTVLEYRRWLGVDDSSLDAASVLVRNDAFTFDSVWSHDGAAISESEWSLESHDISAFADDEPQVYLYWVMGGTNGSVTYPGWNIDDVRVWGSPPEPSCVGAPGEVENLGFPLDKETLAWVRPAEMGGPVAPIYDVLRSELGHDFLNAAICVESDDGTDTVAIDSDQPAAAGVFYYLVRAENACGAGSPGEDSSGTPRPRSLANPFRSPLRNRLGCRRGAAARSRSCRPRR